MLPGDHLVQKTVTYGAFVVRLRHADRGRFLCQQGVYGNLFSGLLSTRPVGRDEEEAVKCNETTGWVSSYKIL